MLTVIKKSIATILWLAATLVAYETGFRQGHQSDAAKPVTAQRRVLYYVDPMNPTHTSDRPGRAPCGMKMEAVYAGNASPLTRPEGASSLAAGAVRLRPEKQQLMGVRVGVVERKSVPLALRALGRVAVNENHLFRINASIDGWITQVGPLTTGSLVKKNEALAACFSPDFVTASQALLVALNSRERQGNRIGTPEPDGPLARVNLIVKRNMDVLKNLGMGSRQIELMIQNQQFPENVDITSPADGFILARNVSPGLHFDKGAELYRIADLHSVWIVADVFEKDVAYFTPGLQASVTLPQRESALLAKVSDALPQFDSVSRTLKVRLEAENPGFLLKPDMFVDVELPVNRPPALVVPADALLDSGASQTVFVDRGNGFFEPRKVTCGQHFGDQVEILQGLTPGEKIVISGRFLLDSESRMQQARAHQAGAAPLPASPEL